MMKHLKQLLFAVTLVVGISISTSAQKEGDKKPPPKPSPPIVVVEPKKPKDDKPKGDDKKKPEAFVSYFKEEE